jgi:hypothetical protein
MRIVAERRRRNTVGFKSLSIRMDGVARPAELAAESRRIPTSAFGPYRRLCAHLRSPGCLDNSAQPRNPEKAHASRVTNLLAWSIAKTMLGRLGP